MNNNIKKIEQDLKGKSVEEIFRFLGYNDSKQIIQRGLYVKLTNKIAQYYELDKWIKKNEPNITRRHLRLSENQKTRESLLVSSLDFISTAQEVWDSSFLKKYFISKTFLFIIYEDAILQDVKKTYMRGIFKWKMPESMINDELYTYWKRLNNTLNEGVVLETGTNGITRNNLPKSSNSKILHVRPQARNKEDTAMLPDGRYLTKQASWLNTRFLNELISLNLPALEISKERIEDNLKVPNDLMKPLYHINDLEIEFKESPEAIKKYEYEGYNWEKEFLISEDFSNVEAYLANTLLKNKYLDKAQIKSYQGDRYLNYRVKKMFRQNKIIQIDSDMYITSSGLLEKGIDFNEVSHSVKTFLGTLHQTDFVIGKQLIENQLFEKFNGIHKLEYFFNSILENHKKLKVIKLPSANLYTLNRKNPVETLVELILNNHESLHLELFTEALSEEFQVEFQYNEIEDFLIRQFDFYSRELYRVFSNQDEIYKYIYK